jgi:hypothetical protein
MSMLNLVVDVELNLLSMLNYIDVKLNVLLMLKYVDVELNLLSMLNHKHGLIIL